MSNRVEQSQQEPESTQVRVATVDETVFQKNRAGLGLFATLYLAMTTYMIYVCIQILSGQ